MQGHQWTTYRAAESTREALQRDAFEVGIALLTAASSSADNSVTVHMLDRTWLVCHTHTTLCVQCVHGLDSKFAKLF